MIGGVLAIIAAIAFAISTFGGHVGSLNLVSLGLVFLALAIAVGGTLPIRRT